MGYTKRYTKGQGAYLFDEAGNRYIDCLSGFGVFACGRNHPAIRDAIKQVMDLDLANMVAMGVATLSGLLARELVRLAPGELEMVFFTNSGTEGVETALEYARAATGRPRLVHCGGLPRIKPGSLSVNGNEEFQEGFGPLLEPVAAVPFNDLAALERELSRGRRRFHRRADPGKGSLPAQRQLSSRGGCPLPQARGPLHRRRSANRAGTHGQNVRLRALGCRARHPGDGQGPFGGLRAGGRVLSKRWIHEKVFSTLNRCFVHSSTFTENDLAMAAGLATLHVLREEKLVENSARMGERLIGGLNEVGRKYEMFAEARGKGLMIGVEFRPPTSLSLKMGWNLLHKLDPSLFCQAMLIPLLTEHHILAQVAGHHLDIIKLLPSLVINEQDVDRLVVAFDRVMGDCHRFPGPVWEVAKRLATSQWRPEN